MKVIAHRGNDNIHKENSLEAILNCMENNYDDGVEIDIRMTKDFKFVIHHDPFYNGHLIKKTLLRTLQKEGLNSLEEVLCKIKGSKILLIEIKEESRHFKILSAKLYRLLKKYDLNYYIQSFNYDLMKYIKEKYPLRCGLLIGIKMNADKINNDFDFNSVNIKHIKKCPFKETFIWTINDKEEFDKVGSDYNIITDRSKYFYDIIYEEHLRLLKQ